MGGGGTPACSVGCNERTVQELFTTSITAALSHSKQPRAGARRAPGLSCWGGGGLAMAGRGGAVNQHGVTSRAD